MDRELYQDLISQGTAYMAVGNYETAKATFEKALEEDPTSVEALSHLGNAFVNLGKFDEALEQFKKALLVEPERGELLYSIASIYLLQGDNLKAIEFYNKAEAVGFKTAEMYQIMAGIFFDADDSIQALRNINRAIAEAPLDGYLRLFKARIYLYDEQMEQALETLEEMQKILPDAFEAYDLRAQILAGMGRHEEALRVCDEGLARFPDDPMVKIVKIKTLVEIDSLEEAKKLIEELRACGKYGEVVKDAAMQEAVIAMKEDRLDDAAKVLEEANTALGGDVDVLYVLMDLYGLKMDDEKLIQVTEKLMAMDTNEFVRANAMYFHAHALDRSGKKEEAQKEFRNITRVVRKMTIDQPTFYEGYIYRLLAHTRLGEYEKALELADYMENVYPDQADAHAFRYYIYKEQGDTEKAEEEKKLAKSIDPKFQL